jgi:hypothetical protein
MKPDRHVEPEVLAPSSVPEFRCGADCQSDGAPAVIVTAVNAAGFVKLTYRAVLTAEQVDALVAKSPNYRVPQNQ